jgi:hypothetical protein
MTQEKVDTAPNITGEVDAWPAERREPWEEKGASWNLKTRWPALRPSGLPMKPSRGERESKMTAIGRDGGVFAPGPEYGQVTGFCPVIIFHHFAISDTKSKNFWKNFLICD